MSDVDDPALIRRWFPICSREDLQPRHIVETELFGRELAVWRSIDGGVNVWANRCPHRGMRLTVGVNLGQELRCAYHGYRFADGSGSCTAVPAQPEKAAPRSLRVRAYPVLQAGSLIWTRLLDDIPATAPLPADADDSVVLYGVAIKAPPATWRPPSRTIAFGRRARCATGKWTMRSARRHRSMRTVFNQWRASTR